MTSAARSGAWLLALALFVAAPGQRPGGSAALPECAQPRESAGEGGFTHRVACERAGTAAALRGPARVLFGLGIDPNRASEATLEALPGIGPARAEAIVAARADGPYRSLADLGRVHGIGPVTLRRVASWLAFDGERP